MNLPSKVVELVNQARAELGLPGLESLPRGKKCSSLECPLAKAIPGSEVRYGSLRFTSITNRGLEAIKNKERAIAISRAWGTSIFMVDSEYRVDLPDILNEFIVRFDWGAYPELEEENGNVRDYNRERDRA